MKTAGVGAAASLVGGAALAQTCPPPPTPTPTPTPSVRGAYVPGEEVGMERIWMAYPNSTAIWGSTLLNQIQTDWALLCRTIAKYEPVYVVCGSAAAAAKARVGATVNPVTYISTIANDDMWMRDSGCVFRRDGKGGIEGVKLNFNGWGNQQTSTRDAVVANGMANYLGIPLITATVKGEGGGVIQDGDGTLIANWSSWTGHNRNPGKTQAQVGAELLRVYGATKMIWCPGIIGQDITDAHIDATCCFIKPGVLAMHRPPAGATDIWTKDAQEVLRILQAATDAKGRKFQFVYLDQPTRPHSTSSDLLKTYINYLVVDGALITVNFGDTTTDAQVRTALTGAYPGHTIEMLNLDRLYTGGGGVHCLTQQQPRA